MPHGRGLKLIWIPKKSNEAQNDSFETIGPQKDNHVKKEFEIGELGQQELQ